MPDSSSTSNLRTGGQILVDCLRLHGVDTVFCVPGESYLATLDAFHDVQDSIRLIVCRQEGGVTNMADAYGKMTGRPGRGRTSIGVFNSASGVMQASALRPLMFMPSEPHTPSPQERRKVRLSSCAFSNSRASSSIMPGAISASSSSMACMAGAVSCSGW